MPHNPGITRPPLVGDFVGEVDPYFTNLLEGLPTLPVPPILLRLAPVVPDVVYLRVGEEPAAI